MIFMALRRIHVVIVLHDSSHQKFTGVAGFILDRHVQLVNTS